MSLLRNTYVRMLTLGGPGSGPSKGVVSSNGTQLAESQKAEAASAVARNIPWPKNSVEHTAAAKANRTAEAAHRTAAEKTDSKALHLAAAKGHKQAAILHEKLAKVHKSRGN